MEIVYVYTRKGSEFRRPVSKFRDRPAETLFEWSLSGIKSSVDADWIRRKVVTSAVQCGAEFSEHEVNTMRVNTASQGILHVEGGWPKEVEYSEVEQVIRYRKNAEKDETYIQSLQGMSTRMIHCMNQNAAIDIYEEYFSDTQFHHAEAPSAKTLTVLRDPERMKRWASCISWHPEGPTKAAIAYSILEFQGQPAGMSSSAYIWDVSNANDPVLELSASSSLSSLAFNPKEHNQIVGGCYNGLIQLWDDRRGTACVETSTIEKSHRDPVSSVIWLPSKVTTECASTSTDGQVLWWDVRKLGEPLEALLLDPKGDGSVIWGGTSLAYDPNAGTTKFLAGTEQGNIVLCTRNRKAKGNAERISTVYPGHHGPVYALSRHPLFSKYFLSAGDWTVRLWNEDLKTPIMTTKYHSSYIMDACWSPARAGVFATVKDDGSLDVWDFFVKQSDPILTVQVTPNALQCLSLEQGGRLVAAGSTDGSTTILQLCDSLAMQPSNESTTILQMLDRETKREKNLEQRARDAATMQKRTNVKNPQQSLALYEPLGDDILKQMEAEYTQQVAILKASMPVRSANVDWLLSEVTQALTNANIDDDINNNNGNNNNNMNLLGGGGGNNSSPPTSSRRAPRRSVAQPGTPQLLAAAAAKRLGRRED